MKEMNVNLTDFFRGFDGFSRSSWYRFRTGQAEITLEELAKVVDELGMELQIVIGVDSSLGGSED